MIIQEPLLQIFGEFLRKADYLTANQEAIKGYYPATNKILHTTGLDFDQDRNFSDIKNNTCPTFAYAGGFISGVRDPFQLLSFLNELTFPFKFLVYTNQPEFLNNFRNTLGEKLIVSSYIPRNELIDILSKVDFLINFDNNTTLNSPSKLIDYAVAGRPVLNITRDFNSGIFMEFLNKNYSRRMVLPDPMQYHIKNVAAQFLELV